MLHAEPAMRLLVTALHRAAYRARVAAPSLALNAVPDVIEVRCPRCDVFYIADLAPEDEPWHLEALEWEAVVQLDAACPAHAHAVTVGP